MGLYEYLGLIIRNLLWPPMGIIMMEEQICQWVYTTLRAYVLYGGGGANVLIVFAVYAIIMFAVFERPAHHLGHVAGHLATRIIGYILRLLFVIVFGWVMLILGAARGRLRGEGQENDPLGTQNVNVSIYHSRFLNVTQSFTRLSWHFRLGRWLYRTAYWALGHISAIQSREQLHRGLARFIALFVILYKAWEIPYLLTH